MPSALSLVRPEAGQESFCCFPALQVVGKEAGLVLRALQKACAVKIRVQPALILGSRGAGPRGTLCRFSAVKRLHPTHILFLTPHFPCHSTLLRLLWLKLQWMSSLLPPLRAIICDLIKQGFSQSISNKEHFKGWSHDPCKKEEGVTNRGSWEAEREQK